MKDNPYILDISCDDTNKVKQQIGICEVHGETVPSFFVEFMDEDFTKHEVHCCRKCLQEAFQKLVDTFPPYEVGVR